MRCSNCSEEVKPVVALDIDGTLGDYHGHFAAFATVYLGTSLDEDRWNTYDGSMLYREWFCETFGVDITTFRQVKLAYRQGGLKRMMPLFYGTRELIGSVREAGAELWLTTTRPWERYDRVDPDTRFWLERHGLLFDGLIYDDQKMQVLADRVDPERVCFILDDQAENLFLAAGLFGRDITVMARTKYNYYGPSWTVMVSDLFDARAMALAHIQDWYMNHQFDELPTTEEPSA